MRKLILQVQMSVDGYVAAANPDLDWQVWDWDHRWPWDKQPNAVLAGLAADRTDSSQTCTTGRFSSLAKPV